MAVYFKAVVLLSVNSRPDAGVTTPNNISESDQIVLSREDCIDLVSLSYLIVVELLKIFAHSHWSNGIPWIEAVEGVAGRVCGE